MTRLTNGLLTLVMVGAAACSGSSSGTPGGTGSSGSTGSGGSSGTTTTTGTSATTATSGSTTGTAGGNPACALPTPINHCYTHQANTNSICTEAYSQAQASATQQTCNGTSDTFGMGACPRDANLIGYCAGGSPSTAQIFAYTTPPTQAARDSDKQNCEKNAGRTWCPSGN